MVLLLIAGYVGWYRETEERSSDLVSFAFVFGSLALVMPLAIATVVHRFGFQISAVAYQLMSVMDSLKGKRSEKSFILLTNQKCLSTFTFSRHNPQRQIRRIPPTRFYRMSASRRMARQLRLLR